MNHSTTAVSHISEYPREQSLNCYIRAFLAGIILPLSFAPFHIPGLAILSLALFFMQLIPMKKQQAFLIGFAYGFGFFGFGISWIYVSIHQFGHLNPLLAGGITCIFIAYLALYLGFVAACFNSISKQLPSILSALLFSALWCLGEFLRSKIIGGFPWLMIGFGQIDSPLGELLPWIGVPGVSFLTCFSATLLTLGIRSQGFAKYLWLTGFILFILSPLMLKSKISTKPLQEPLSIGIVQANLSMRDKWDESLFWHILKVYHHEIEQLLGKKQLIVLPESAIPLPTNYVNDFLETLDLQAKASKSSILLGIPHPTRYDASQYHNAIIGLGEAEGVYFKQHLVAFGEFMPAFLTRLADLLELPLPNLVQGPTNQPHMTINHHPIATLICYELAFPELLRKQLPQAQWIVSISDDGWFGHSLAVFQHLQMAQVLSKMTSRYQIVSNNDGLSAVIEDHGKIIEYLPAFSRGILEASITPNTSATPWSTIGDHMIYFIMFSLIIICILLAKMHQTIAGKL